MCNIAWGEQMNKFCLITLGVVVILGVIAFAVLSMRDDQPDLEGEIAKASAEFKAQMFRAEPAKKLVPLLKIGMTTREVEGLLGEPNTRRESDGVLYWYYGLDYSLFIDVRFDSNGKVEEITACAPGLGDESSDKDKPSGY